MVLLDLESESSLHVSFPFLSLLFSLSGFGRLHFSRWRLALTCADKLILIQAENADDWSYQAGIKGGWIPATDPAQKIYGNLCGY